MKKKLLIIIPIILILLFLALQPLGSQYDSEIEQVIDLENQHLSDQGDVKLKRKNANFHVYADGGYVEIRYDTNGEEQQAVYEELDGGTYERHDEMPEGARNLTREYEEENK
ncbi:cystatin-like fold lipoprotein [Terribacillus sp. 179-K 1B1 HS]|uniref:cystatin-like fold lipoprotein n=1 Tax=Terribacillus sp. 179-K 1B1 HS TaxID=3142388 RepID=UPI00399FE743